MDAGEAKAFVRPYDFEVSRQATAQSGLRATLVRTVVVGPVARIELTLQGAENTGPAQVIDAQIPTSLFQQQGFKDGETLVLSPRKARVFAAGA